MRLCHVALGLLLVLGITRPGQAATTISSTTILSSTVWGPTGTPADSSYLIAPSSGTTLTINNGATLTIQPGTSIYFSSGKSLVIDAGSLIANGTGVQAIVFSSSDGTRGGWGALDFLDNSDDGGRTSTLSNCTIKGGGAGGFQIREDKSVALTLSACTVAEHLGEGLQLINASGAAVSSCTFRDFGSYPVSGGINRVAGYFTNNTFVPRPDGKFNAIRLRGATVTQSTTLTAPDSGFCYITAGENIAIDTQGGAPILTIADGTVIKLAGNGSADALIKLGSGGTPTSSGGLSAHHVVFTSVFDDTLGDTNGDGPTPVAAGQWQAILEVSGPITLDQCIVRYGGQRYGAGVRTSGTDPTITGCTISENMGNGLSILDVFGGVTAGGVSSNTFWGNTSYPVAAPMRALASIVPNSAWAPRADGQFNGFQVRGGSVPAAVTLVRPPVGFCYITAGEQIEVVGSPTPVLTIASGTVMKMQGNAGASALLQFGRGGVIDFGPGALVAKGVVFTSVQDDTLGDTNGDGPSVGAPGQWQAINFDPNAAVGPSSIDSSIVRYGGQRVAAAILIGGGSPTISHSTIEFNLSSAIKCVGGGGGAQILRNWIRDSSIGVDCSSGASPRIWFNALSPNSTYGVRNTSSATTVDADSNWWGNSSGPYHPTQNPSGTGTPVSDFVAFSPWLQDLVPAPSGLTVTRASNVCPPAALIQWQDNTSDEEYFEIQYDASPGSWSSVAIVPRNTTQWLATGLIYGNNYEFRVRGCNQFACSGWSNVATLSVIGETRFVRGSVSATVVEWPFSLAPTLRPLPQVTVALLRSEGSQQITVAADTTDAMDGTFGFTALVQCDDTIGVYLVNGRMQTSDKRETSAPPCAAFSSRVALQVVGADSVFDLQSPSGPDGTSGDNVNLAYLTERMTRDFWQQKLLVPDTQWSHLCAQTGVGAESPGTGLSPGVITQTYGRSFPLYKSGVAHEFSHRMLFQKIGHSLFFENSTSPPYRQAFPMDEGLADYFAASYDNDPRIHPKHRDGYPSVAEFLRDISKVRRQVTCFEDYDNTDRPKVYQHSLVISGALWDWRSTLVSARGVDAAEVDRGIFNTLPELGALPPEQRTFLSLLQLLRSTSLGEQYKADLDVAFLRHNIGEQPQSNCPLIMSVWVLENRVFQSLRRISLAWHPAVGAASYRVYAQRSSGSGLSPGEVVADSISDTTYVYTDADTSSSIVLFVAPVDSSGTEGLPSHYVSLVTGVEEQDAAVGMVTWRVYPSPSPGAVHFSLSGRAGRIRRISIYDVQGRMVQELHWNTQLQWTDREFVWDGYAQSRRLAGSGVYFARVDTDQGVLTRKFVLAR